PTAASGTWKHKQLGNVKSQEVLPLALWSILGAFASATVATRLPSHTLRVGFAVFLFAVGAKLAFTQMTRPAKTTS
ncbi:MAG TPA: sulfite exporter TauE/SafE family protein, partial [Candidatus Eisenbacteria bacterium]|nr:sulfite exporter TauE/SafE family protein [Candidatus Eisenbacteria bacterium]